MKPILTVMLVLAGLALASPAAAYTPDPLHGRTVYNNKIAPAANPSKAFAALTDTNQADVKAFLKTTSVKKTATVHCMPNRSCPLSWFDPDIADTVTVVFDYTNPLQSTGTCVWTSFQDLGTDVLGSLLWTYNQRVDWCWNGGLLTAAYSNHWGVTHMALWAFDGVIGSSESGGVGSPYYTAFSSARFKFCILWDAIGCVQENDPWIRQTVYAGNPEPDDAGGS